MDTKGVAGFAAFAALSLCGLAAEAGDYAHGYNYWWSAPGAACSFYSGTSAADNHFSRHPGPGVLQNVSTVTAKAECPIQLGTATFYWWSIRASGTSGFSLSTCNVFSADLNSGYGYPTANNHITTPASGVTEVSGSVANGYDLPGTAEIICSIPANSTVYNYRWETNY